MGSRLIRGDDLLESDRFMTLPERLQSVWFKLFCAADLYGLHSLALRQLARVYGKTPTPRIIERDFGPRSELVARDLVRPYGDETVGFYVFIPRYGQRLRAYASRCALPPPKIYEDDEHARKLFNENKHLFKKVATGGGAMSTSGGGLRPDVDGDEDVEKDVERAMLMQKSGTHTAVIPDAPAGRGPTAARSNSFFENTKIKGAIRGPDWWAKHLKLRNQREGESVGEYIEFVEIQARQFQQRGAA